MCLAASWMGGMGKDRMHCQFFGLSENPFGVTADPKFLYRNSGLRDILAALISGISDRRGLMTIVGDSGTGKTTLLNAMLGRLDEKIKVARLSNTNITFEEMLTMALADLGLADPLNRLSATEAWHRLHEFAIRQQAEGGNVVLLVDEAQNLDGLCIRNLHRLIETDNGGGKLIQVILSRLPEWDGKLNQPTLGRLSEQPDMRWHIDPLNKQDTYTYIQHRLAVAGYKGPGLFTRNAQRLIWNYSRGVPRKINTLCKTALLISYTRGEKRIRASLVKKAMKETSWRPYSGIGSRHGRMAIEQCPPQSTGKISHARFALAASLMFAACLTLVTGLLVAHSRLKLKSHDSHAYHGVVQSERSVQPDGSVRSPSLDGQPVVFARVSMGQGFSAARMSAENVKPSVHSAVVPEKEKRPVQVAFLIPVDEERILRGGSASPMGRAPVKSERAQGRAPDVKPDISKAENAVIQVGAFRVRATAERLIRRLREKGYDPYLEIQTLQDLGLIHRVRLSGYGSVAGARTAMARLQAQGFDDVFVVSLKTHRPF
jgi:type II secretory pathway predicted ATPase ExeA/cell division septation protein DedD